MISNGKVVLKVFPGRWYIACKPWSNRSKVKVKDIGYFSRLLCYSKVIREFKKLRRQLQRKRRVKIELCVQLRLLPLFIVDHVVQNRWTALSLDWYKWFSCKGKEWKIYRCELPLSSEPQIWKFNVVVLQTTSKHCTKSVPHVQHDYFSSFNQSSHWFVSLSLTLPSSNLKLLLGRWRTDTCFLFRCLFNH